MSDVSERERVATDSLNARTDSSRNSLAESSPAPGWRAWLRTENLGLGLTLGYLFLTALGMFHRALVFLMFRINVFDYAQPSDFLLAALRDPLIIIASVAPIPIVALYFKWSYRFQNRSGKANWLLFGGDKSRALANKYRQPLYVLTAVLWALAASLHYANRVADDLRAGKGRRVHVELLAPSIASVADTSPLLLLGTTQNYVFLYDASRQMTSIVPVNNISRIRVDRRKSPAAASLVPATTPRP